MNLKNLKTDLNGKYSINLDKQFILFPIQSIALKIIKEETPYIKLMKTYCYCKLLRLELNLVIETKKNVYYRNVAKMLVLKATTLQCVNNREGH